MANFSALKSVAKNDMPVPYTAAVDVDNHLQTFKKNSLSIFHSGNLVFSFSVFLDNLDTMLKRIYVVFKRSL